MVRRARCEDERPHGLSEGLEAVEQSRSPATRLPAAELAAPLSRVAGREKVGAPVERVALSAGVRAAGVDERPLPGEGPPSGGAIARAGAVSPGGAQHP